MSSVDLDELALSCPNSFSILEGNIKLNNKSQNKLSTVLSFPISIHLKTYLSNKNIVTRMANHFEREENVASKEQHMQSDSSDK